MFVTCMNHVLLSCLLSLGLANKIFRNFFSVYYTPLWFILRGKWKEILSLWNSYVRNISWNKPDGALVLQVLYYPQGYRPKFRDFLSLLPLLHTSYSMRFTLTCILANYWEFSTRFWNTIGGGVGWEGNNKQNELIFIKILVGKR